MVIEQLALRTREEKNVQKTKVAMFYIDKKTKLSYDPYYPYYLNLLASGCILLGLPNCRIKLEILFG